MITIKDIEYCGFGLDQNHNWQGHELFLQYTTVAGGIYILLSKDDGTTVFDGLIKHRKEFEKVVEDWNAGKLSAQLAVNADKNAGNIPLPPVKEIRDPQAYADMLYWLYYNKYELSFNDAVSIGVVVKSLAKDAVNNITEALKSYGHDSDELQNMDWYWRYYDSVLERIENIPDEGLKK